MALNILRTTDFKGSLYQRFVDHNVLIVSKQKDDYFKDVLKLQSHITGHFSMILHKVKFQQDEFNELWNMGHPKMTFATIYTKYYKNLQAVMEALCNRTLKPTYLLTDDASIGELLKDSCSFYVVYPSMKIVQHGMNKTIESLCLEKPIDMKNPLHRLYFSGFGQKPNLSKINVRKFLKDIPAEYILFTALGTYRKEYNYHHVIASLYTLLEHGKGQLRHKIFLLLGGNYNECNINDEEYYHIVSSNIRTDLMRFNVIFLGRISVIEKKDLLRRSNAMIYMNANPSYNPDLRLSLSVGCPIICLKAGYAEHVIIHGYSGYHLEKILLVKLAVYMYRLTNSLRHEYHSECARKHYIKEHTLTTYTLDTFREEDTPRPPKLTDVQKQQKSRDPNIKGKNKSKKPAVTNCSKPSKFKNNKTKEENDALKHFLRMKSYSTNTLNPVRKPKKIKNKSSKKSGSTSSIKGEQKANTDKNANTTTEPYCSGTKFATEDKQTLRTKITSNTKTPLTKTVALRNVALRNVAFTSTKAGTKSEASSKSKKDPKASKPIKTSKPAPKPSLPKPHQSVVRAVGAFPIKNDPPPEPGLEDNI